MLFGIGGSGSGQGQLEIFANSSFLHGKDGLEHAMTVGNVFLSFSTRGRTFEFEEQKWEGQPSISRRMNYLAIRGT